MFVLATVLLVLTCDALPQPGGWHESSFVNKIDHFTDNPMVYDHHYNYNFDYNETADAINFLHLMGPEVYIFPYE